MKFNTYSASAPHDSDQWATTDRGWLYEEYSGVDSIGEPVTGEKTVGNYLDYGPLHSRYDDKKNSEPGNVHAVYHGSIVDWTRPVEFWQSGPTKSKCLPTVEAAKAWLVEMHSGQKALL